MCDFVNILNLLLDRVSMGPFIFELPKNTILFSDITHPTILFNKNPKNNICLYKNLDNLSQSLVNFKINGATPSEEDYINLQNINSRNKKLSFSANDVEENSEGICLTYTNENLSLFNYVKFKQFYIEKLTDMRAENALILCRYKRQKITNIL